MFYPIIFVAVALAALVSSILIFIFRDTLHAIIALTMLFLANSFLFLMLDQVLLAVIQLFIMIGGISTFLFVGAASSQLPRFRFTRVASLLALWAAVFAVIAYPVLGMGFSTNGSNVFANYGIASSVQSSIAVFYALAILVFGVGLGAVMLLKSMGAHK